MFYVDSNYKENPAPQELMDRIKELCPDNRMRMFVLPKASWTNVITRKKETLHNIPVVAQGTGSEYIQAVNEIRVYDISVREYTMAAYDIYANKRPLEIYIFHEYYGHVNLCSGYAYYTIVDAEQEKIYLIKGQSICNAVRCFTVNEMEEEDIIPILIGNLSGQQSGDSYQTVMTRHNGYKEITLMSGGYIAPTAPVMQLLTQRTLSYLRQITPKELFTLMNDTSQPIPKDDDHIAIKLRYSSNYILIKRDELDVYLESKDPEKSISSEYPVIEYKDVQAFNIEMPKEEIDVACIGLGSAGTGILDQLVRSTYMHSVSICDMDKVEGKNLRNQWYRQSDVGYTKVYASTCILRGIPYGSITVHEHNGRFQETNIAKEGKFKYTISGFDSTEARLELLDWIEKGELETKYLIDTRYDDLAASVYFIDVANKKQVDYYRQGLLEDHEAFVAEQKKNRCKSREDFIKYIDAKDPYVCKCTQVKLFIRQHINENRQRKGVEPLTDFDSLIQTTVGAGERFCIGSSCSACKEQQRWARIWDVQSEFIDLDMSEVAESSCVKQNFIDIYKFSSSFVFAAIRELENENPKPFTHVEVSTDGIPQYAVLLP